MASRNLLPESGSTQKSAPKNDAKLLSIREIYSHSHAIVIGISCYKEERLNLNNPVNDAREVARVLKEKHGFDDVQLILDSEATLENLAQVFYDKIRSADITNDDRLLVYYSGHGDIRQSADQEGNSYAESFLIPFDAKLCVYSSYLNLDTVTKNCRLCSAKHVLLILDSCFSGTALVERRGTPKPDIINDDYLKMITNTRSVQAIAATGKSQLALDSGIEMSKLNSAHGAFTGILLQVLNSDFDPENDGILTASELGQYLVRNVPRGGIPQNPLYGYLPGSETGDFIFNIYARPSSDGSSKLDPFIPNSRKDDEMSPLVKAATDYYFRKDYGKAIVFYDRILEINPQNIESLNRKGISCMRLKKLKDASDCFNRVLNIDPKNIEAQEFLTEVENLKTNSDENILLKKKAKEQKRLSQEETEDKNRTTTMAEELYRDAEASYKRGLALYEAKSYIDAAAEFGTAQDFYLKAFKMNGDNKYYKGMQEAMQMYGNAVHRDEEENPTLPSE
ncbi:MAG: caspase family protein [Nitrososphaera sp.]